MGINVQPYHLSIIGLLTDIVGAFLVSVEAIKIHNVKYLCDNVLRRIHHQTLSPSIIIEGEEPPSPFIANWASRHVALFMSLHYLAGALVLALMDLLSGGMLRGFAVWAVENVLMLKWYWIGLIALATTFFGGVVGLWALGEIVHVSIVSLLKKLISALELIQQRYADGTVGILGFALLFTGFVLQAVAAYVGRPTAN